MFGARRVLVSAFMVFAVPSLAQDLTAGVVLNRMNSDQMSGYLAGVVEGLAYARYVADGKSTAGMGCVYDWLYDPENNAQAKTLEAFRRYPDHTPAAIVAILVRQKCGG